MITSNLSELEFARLELDNLIKGREISKEIYKAENYNWSDEDERELNLFKLIKDILSRIEVKHEKVQD